LRNLDYVKSLGADRVLDCGSPQPFADVAGIDLVLDLAGGGCKLFHAIPFSERQGRSGSYYSRYK
jgi:hypothetical protein